jgi:hypothetical protein
MTKHWTLSSFKLIANASVENPSENKIIFSGRYHDDDHGDGVRLRLRTAATSGTIVHPAGDI